MGGDAEFGQPLAEDVSQCTGLAAVISHCAGGMSANMLDGLLGRQAQSSCITRREPSACGGGAVIWKALLLLLASTTARVRFGSLPPPSSAALWRPLAEQRPSAAVAHGIRSYSAQIMQSAPGESLSKQLPRPRLPPLCRYIMPSCSAASPVLGHGELGLSPGSRRPRRY